MAESTPTPQNTAADLPRCLLGHWIRSHEEDKAGVRAYRPASYKFPPSRGRDGLEFRPRGELVYFGIARGDGSESLPGAWVLEGSRPRPHQREDVRASNPSFCRSCPAMAIS